MNSHGNILQAVSLGYVSEADGSIFISNSIPDNPYDEEILSIMAVDANGSFWGSFIGEVAETGNTKLYRIAGTLANGSFVFFNIAIGTTFDVINGEKIGQAVISNMVGAAVGVITFGFLSGAAVTLTGGLGIPVALALSEFTAHLANETWDYFFGEEGTSSLENIYDYITYLVGPMVELSIYEDNHVILDVPIIKGQANVLQYVDEYLSDEIHTVEIRYANSTEIFGTSQDNTLWTNEGWNATIIGGGGSDRLEDGAGDSKLYGYTAEDPHGGTGSDTLVGGEGADTLYGGGGNDTIYCDLELNGGSYPDYDDLAYGGAGNDEIWGGRGQDVLYGDQDHASLTGDGNDTLIGELGNDSLVGGGNDDLLYGDGRATNANESDGGSDWISGDEGNDTGYGGGGGDHLFGGTGDDELHGDAGNDQIYGEADSDHLFGDAGNDLLVGDSGNDVLHGGDDADKLYGGLGNDCLLGGSGDDFLIDNSGYNYFSGGEGADSLWGQSTAGGYDIYDNLGAWDIVQDDDGQGAVYLGTHLVSEIHYWEDEGDHGVYFDDYGNFYVLRGKDLNILTSGGLVRIWQWDEGELGITITSKAKDPENPEGGPRGSGWGGSGGGSLSGISSYAGQLAAIDGDVPSSALDIAGGLCGVASAQRSPIVFDLDGDGISLVALEDSVAFFDLDNDGFREKTQWVAATDGLLALDANANGRIDDKAELFGDEAGFGNGYAKLRAHDANADGVIDASDAVFADLRIWQDADSDGYTDEGELKTLAELGIASLSLTADSTLSSAYTRTDGTTGQTQDAFFEHSQLHTIYGGEVNLASEALFLPWLRGYGTVKDLPIAVSENSDLLTLVAEMAEATNPADLWSRLDELLAKWTGADAIDPTTMRGEYSARKLSILEALTGQGFVMEKICNGEITLTTDAIGSAVPLLENAYKIYQFHFFGNFAAQTFWTSKFPDAGYNFALDRIVFPVEGDDLTSYLADVVNASNGEDAPFLAKLLKNMGGDTGVTIEALAPSIDGTWRYLFENIDEKFAFGTAAGESLSLGDETAMLFGFSGADTLEGSASSDTLIGGVGDDTLIGGYGNDTYVFNLGDGQDTIRDEYSTNYAGLDTIRFGSGIAMSDLTFTLAGNDLLISFADNATDGLLLKNWLDSNKRIEKLAFSDGNTVDISATPPAIGLSEGADSVDLVSEMTTAINLDGLGGDDTLAGTSYADTLAGGLGNDSLSGNNGNDSLIGGAGDDTLLGGLGNDTYVFNLGDGQDVILDEYSSINAGTDTIHFGSGITMSDLTFTLAGNDLLISFAGNATDGLRLQNWMSFTQRIEKLQFSDGNVVDISATRPTFALTNGADAVDFNSSDFVGLPLSINGLAGDDLITTTYANDTLAGGADDDTLQGGGGYDVYVFNLGDGQDIIRDVRDNGITNAGTDTISLGTDILSSDIALFMDGNNLVIGMAGTDQVTIQGQAATNTAIETVSLASGAYLTAADISQVISDMASFAAGHGMTLTSVDDVKNSPDLMSIIVNSWHQP